MVCSIPRHKTAKNHSDGWIIIFISSIYCECVYLNSFSPVLYKFKHTRLTCEHRHWYFNSTDAWKYGNDNKRMNFHSVLIKSLHFACDQLFFRHVTPSVNSLLNSHRLVRYNRQLLLICFWGMFEKLLLHHSQGSSTERWSRSTLRLITARVFYVIRGSFNVPPYFLRSNLWLRAFWLNYIVAPSRDWGVTLRL